MQILGCGAFGSVRLAKDKNGKYIALKVLKKQDLIKSRQVSHIKNEIKIMSIVNQPFVVDFIGYDMDTKYIQILLEFVQGGELFTYLRNEEKFPEAQSKFQSSQIALIFEQLHNQNIVYRDLKPENILINHDGQLKLADFGFAKLCPTKTQTLCGTPQQIAPEIIMNKGHGKAVDWWALGILIYEMLHGIDPFDANDTMEVYSRILACKVKFTRIFPSDAKSLVKHLLTSDLSKRQGGLTNGPNDVKQHRWQNGLNYTDILEKKVSPDYVPPIKNESDTSNFDDWPEDKAKVNVVDTSLDPFNDLI